VAFSFEMRLAGPLGHRESSRPSAQIQPLNMFGFAALNIAVQCGSLLVP